ncbi:hypothetical protein Unana1_01268 [Umbelopsis nana]
MDPYAAPHIPPSGGASPPPGGAASPLSPRDRRDRSISPRRSSDPYSRHRRSSYRDDYHKDDHRSSRYRDDYYDRYRDDRYDRYDRGYDRYDRDYDRYGRPPSRHAPPPRGRPKRPVYRGNEEDRKSSTTIYVGNLPYSFRDADVAALFERYGRIRKTTVLLDNMTGKNKGFAFVEFEERRDAEDAFDKFDGFSVEGRRLKLDWDVGIDKKEDRRPRPTGDREHSRGPADRPSPPPHSGSARGYSPDYGRGRSASPYDRR